MGERRLSDDWSNIEGRVIMDSFVFVGWRIDVTRESENVQDWYDVSMDNVGMPYESNSWNIWNCNDRDVKEDRFALIRLIDDNIPYFYWCPFGFDALQSQVNDHGSIDFPDDALDHIKMIIKDPVFEKLVEIYGRENIKIRWGIFKGWG